MKQIKQTIFLCLLWMIGIGVHAEEIPNNEIWYTSSDGKVVTPNNSNFFGASIISNTYSNGKGVIKFDNSVTSIGNGAFSDCSGLASITIPNSVTSIGDWAFNGCSGLTSITIPNSVTSIGEGAFFGCSGLTSIDIPNSVTSIGYYAFRYCSGLTSITIPNSVTSIGSDAFYGCTGLTSITIPNSVTSIGDRAFSGCSGLTSITIPNSVTSIGSYAFNGCSGLTSITIPNSVTSIGDRAFSGCSGLTSITIPNSVTSIGSDAFYECRNIETLVWGTNISPYCVTQYCNVNLKKVVLDGNITSIGDRAFSGCSGLTSITIPNSVTSIGYEAFRGCSGLTSITIPNSVTSIGNGAFERCSGLTSITIPNSVTSIGNGAFERCSGLTSITIPNSVTSIGSDAFYGCDGLTSITIPNSVTSIGDYAFGGCDGLTSITIPNSVTSIGSYAFNGCSGLTSITIPNSVKSIGDWAFSDCSGLTSIEIPNSVTSIGDGAFGKCSGLTSIEIPNSVTSIGDGAFGKCSGLTSITVESSNSNYDSRDNCNAIIETATNTLIVGCNNTVIPNSVTSIGDEAFWMCSGLTSITIPNSVTSIGDEAFWMCSGLTSITIPNSVTSIGDEAFRGCSGLTSINIPNSVTSIEYGTFMDCSGLTSITIPNSVTSIGDDAFYKCSGLTSITIPNSVTSIGRYAFESCSGLTSITIPNSVTSIGEYAFSYCSNLTSITIPNSVTSIGNYAFEGCYISDVIWNSNMSNHIISNSYIRNLTIGDSVITVYDTFNGSNLKNISLGKSVKYIRTKAFSSSSYITEIRCYTAEPPYCYPNVFNTAIYSKVTLYVPLGCKNAYQHADQWKEFANIVEFDIYANDPNHIEFNNYKTSILNDIESLTQSGDSPAVLSLINTAKDSINALVYDESKSLEDNKAVIDGIIEKLKSDIDAQREVDKLAADKAAFEAYKSAKESDADDLSKDGDSPIIIGYISDAKTAIDKLIYDESMSLDDNKKAVDAVFNKLESDVKAQRIAEQLAADKIAFDAYKNTRIADAEDMVKDGDSPAVHNLITTAMSTIDALTYDESMSLDDNKKAVDAVFNKLESDVKAQREAEELWANKLAFNTYRNSRKSDADALAKPNDSQEILAIITRAKEEIEGLEYDQSKSLSDNMAAVDAIIRQLKTDLENARIAAGMNGIITSDGNLQIHTLDGRKVDSIVKSGFYIINGVKKYVNGNCK